MMLIITISAIACFSPAFSPKRLIIIFDFHFADIFSFCL